MSTPSIVATYLFLAAVWGGSFMLMRVGVPEFGPYAFGGLRVVIAGLALLPFLLTAKRLQEFRAHWLKLSVIGVVTTGLPFLLFSHALQSLNAGVGSVLNASVPVMTGVIAYVFFRERLSMRQWLGLFVGMLGVAFLMFDGISQGINFSAFLAALGACLCYATGSNLAKHHLSQISSMTIAASALVVSGLVMLPVVLLTFPEQVVSIKAWGAAVAVALFSTAVAMVLFYNLIKAIGPTKAVTLTLVTPIFGIFWGMLFLGEQLTAQMIVGTLVVLCGTALSVLPTLPKKPNKHKN